MIQINDRKLEKQINGILQNSRFASVKEYLIYVIGRDAALARKKGL